MSENNEDIPALSALFNEWERSKNLRVDLTHRRLIVETDIDATFARTSMEFGCFANTSFMSDELLVGATNERLRKLPLTLKLIRANDELAKDLLKDNAFRKEKLDPDSPTQTDFVGLMNYYGPSEHEGTTEGSLNSWVILAAESFDTVSSRLFSAGPQEVAMNMTIRFPIKDSNWDGKSHIDVVALKIIFPHNCDGFGKPLDPTIDDDSFEHKPDGAALQLVASNDIRAQLSNIHRNIIWIGAAIFIAIIAFR